MSSTALPAPGSTQAPGERAGRRDGLYRAVWRWHFYAGLFAIPVIVLLCLTGLLYLFRPQIEGAVYDDLMHVRPGPQHVSYQQQLATVQNAYPGSSVFFIGPQPSADRSTQFGIEAADGSFYSVFVDPYTSRILGDRNDDKSPVGIALQLHGSLMTGSWLGNDKYGDWFIELVASWTVVLLATGVFLWWPRGRKLRALLALPSRLVSLRPRRLARGALVVPAAALYRTIGGIFVPRLRTGSRRIVWRDVHAITGVMFAFVTLFFLVSGLAWSGFWGANYGKLVTNDDYPPEVVNGVSSQTIGDLAQEGKVPWAAGFLPVPLSGEPGNPTNHAREHDLTFSWDPTRAAPLDAIVATAQRLGLQPGYAIFTPGDEMGAYTISTGEDLDPKPAQSQLDARTVFVDQYTAEPIASFRDSDNGLAARATGLGISIHTGREWGVWSQVLAAAGTLAILLSCATSIVMWRKRRPKGLGAPRRAPSRRALAGLATITLTLGVLFPMVGMSLAAVLLLDFLVLRRIPRLARALSMA